MTSPAATVEPTVISLDTETEPYHGDLWCATLSAEPGTAYQVRSRAEFRRIYNWFRKHPEAAAGFHNCLTGDTRVWLTNGSKATLAQMVKERHPGPVLTVNERTGAIESHAVLGWIKGPTREWGDWVRIRVRGKGCLRLTVDHQVITTRGRVPAGEVRVGDRIYRGVASLSSMQEALIYGSLLGDASLDLRGYGRSTVRSPKFKVAHDHRSGYTEFKARILGLTDRIKVIDNDRGFSAGTGSKLSLVETPRDSRLLDLWEACTREGRRTVTDAWLAKLDDAALAIWVCDDGSSSRTSIAICVEAFRDRGLDKLLEFLQKRGWKVRVKERTSDGKLYMYIRDAKRDVWPHLAPYVPLCMSYKVPEALRDLCNEYLWEDGAATGASTDEVVEVGPLLRESGSIGRYRGYTPRKNGSGNPRRGLAQYCLVVGRNRNFFAEGLSVSNCLFDLPKLQDVVPPYQPLDDTFIAARLLQLDSAGLKELSRRFLGMRMQSYAETVAPEQRRVSIDYLRLAMGVAARPNFPAPAPRWEWDVDSKTREPVFKLKKPTPLHRVGKPKRKGDPVPNTGKLAKLLADVEGDKRDKDGKPINPLTRWKDWGDEVAPIEAELGPHPIAFLEHVDPDKALFYSCRDADATGRLLPVMKAKLREANLERAYRIDMQAAPVVARMIHVGVGVDRPYLEELSATLENKIVDANAVCWELAGRMFNPNSDTQVRQLLFVEKKLPVRGFTDARLPSTQDDYLLPFQLQEPLIIPILKVRKLTKLKSTYCDALYQWSKRDGRIHSAVGMTVNGRYAFREPNLMAIPQRPWQDIDPKWIKHAFVASEDKVFVYIDLSQIEMRVLAHLSLDEDLLEIYWNDRDIHLETAINVLGAPVAEAKDDYWRLPSKRANFGIVYGLTGEGLFVQLDQEVPGKYTPAQCEGYIKSVLEKRHGVSRYMSDTAGEARRSGEVRDLFGYRRLCYGAQSSDEHTRSTAEREAINFPVSSSAVAIMKTIMGQEWLAMGGWPGVEPVLQVHDALVHECHPDIAPDFLAWELDEVRRIGEELGMAVPITAGGKIGRRLDEMEEGLVKEAKAA